MLCSVSGDTEVRKSKHGPVGYLVDNNEEKNVSEIISLINYGSQKNR